MANLSKVSQQFFDGVVVSINFCPMYKFTHSHFFLNFFFYSQLREICHILQTATNERFPGHENDAIGNFMFLRFITPAIVAPEGFGIITGNTIPPFHGNLMNLYRDNKS